MFLLNLVPLNRKILYDEAIPQNISVMPYPIIYNSKEVSHVEINSCGEYLVEDFDLTKSMASDGLSFELNLDGELVGVDPKLADDLLFGYRFYSG